MNINISIADYKELLFEASRQGAKMALSESGLYRDEISQRKAWHIYGRGYIENLLNLKLIKRNSGLGGNSKCTFSRLEIESALQAQKTIQGYGVRGIKKALEGTRIPN